MQGECFLCGQYNQLDLHHIFGAWKREKSDKYKLTVYLCRDCHTTGKNAVHRNADIMLNLHQYGQRKFMSERNATIEEFIKEFGKNYL